MMKKQIVHVSPHQTSKVLALVYVCAAIPFILFGLLVSIIGGTPGSVMMRPAPHPGLGFFIIMPILLGGAWYIFTILTCVVYNLLAKRIGGIEFTLTDMQES